MGLRCGDRVVVIALLWLGWMCVVCHVRSATSLSSDRRCRVVVRDVSFGERLHICDAHAMREDQPVLMRMHDA